MYTILYDLRKDSDNVLYKMQSKRYIMLFDV